MYQLFAPSLRLAKWVDCYWVSNFLQSESLVYTELFVAQYAPNLIFNLSGSYHRNADICTGSVLETLNTSPILFTHPIENRLFGVRLKPAALLAFFEGSAAEWSDAAVLLTDIWGVSVAELEEKLYNATDARTQILCIEDFLAHRICEKRLEMTDLYQNTMTILETSFAQANPIQHLLTELNMTHRTLDRHFQTYLGLSPKKMLRLVRFQSYYGVLHTEASKKIDFFDFSYYDQAHFSKEFKTFCGFSPTNYTNSEYFVQNLQGQHLIQPLPL
jgi:methylphosphotriester-DNA--protein-cysteine methyltransferase